jgi:hypothetical protein
MALLLAVTGRAMLATRRKTTPARANLRNVPREIRAAGIRIAFVRIAFFLPARRAHREPSEAAPRAVTWRKQQV